jgi:hypothetical protein
MMPMSTPHIKLASMRKLQQQTMKMQNSHQRVQRPRLNPSKNNPGGQNGHGWVQQAEQS